MNDSAMHTFGQNLTKRILIAMLSGVVAGVLIYFLASSGLGKTAAFVKFDALILNGLIDIVGKVFVASLKVMVVPLVFVSLVCGVASLKDGASIGVISFRTIALYFCTTALAISVALALSLIVQPGIGGESLAAASSFEAKPSPGLKSVLLNIFPTNIVNAMAAGNMLQIIVFAILFGMAINRAETEGAPVLAFFQSMDKVIMRLVLLVMELAPVGIFCLMVAMFASTGPEHILRLAKYFFTVIAALLIHLGATLSVLLIVFGRLNPWIFFKKIRAIWLFAFSTASSNATIPVTLNTVENRLGVSNKVAAFTVPLGATINMDGTAIMQGVATVFIAQTYGIDIGLSGYLMVILTATLASIGTAGVPGVGMITLALVLEQVGLPVEGIALIIGIDRLLDMVRTAVNVSGDAAVATIVARSTGNLDESIYNGPIPKESN